MSDLMIKPLRAYEDRGIIRDVDHEPYAAPVWLAKELEQLKLCKIVSEGGSDQPAAMTLAKKGQRWIIVDAHGSQVGDFIGKREEAEAELAKLVESPAPTSATDGASSAQPDAAATTASEGNGSAAAVEADNPPQE